jgi:hypothetical protein
MFEVLKLEREMEDWEIFRERGREHMSIKMRPLIYRSSRKDTRVHTPQY